MAVKQEIWQKAVEEVVKYFNTRLGERIELKEADLTTINKGKINVTCHPKEGSERNLDGIFKQIISKYQFDFTIWLDKEHESLFTVRSHVRYEHPSGGRNGHELPINLQGRLRGTEVVLLEI